MDVSGQLHAPAALTQRNSLRYLLDRRFGESQSWPQCNGEEKSSYSCRNPNYGRLAPSQSVYKLSSELPYTVVIAYKILVGKPEGKKPLCKI
jgi:hypothetical protein